LDPVNGRELEQAQARLTSQSHAFGIMRQPRADPAGAKVQSNSKDDMSKFVVFFCASVWTKGLQKKGVAREGTEEDKITR
jgi:hypothetical protein